MSRLVFWWFLFGLGIIPAVMWPWGELVYEVPRVYFFLVWVAGLVGLGGLFFLKQFSRKHLSFSLLLLLVIWVMAVMISSLQGTSWEESVWGNYYRLDGMIVLWSGVLLTLILGFNWSKRWWLGLVKVITGSFLLVAAWSLIDFLLGKKLMGPFGLGQLMAGYITVSWPFVYEARKYMARWLVALATGLGMAALVVSGAMGSIVLSGAYGAWLLINTFKSRKIKALLALLVLGMTALVGVSFGQSESLGSPQGRIRIYQKMWLAFLDRPVLGWGFSQVGEAWQQIEWPMAYQHDVYVDKAHSTLLEYLVTGGVVGFGIYVLVVVGFGLALLRLAQTDKEQGVYRAMLAVYLLFVIQAQLNVISIATEMYFWLALGITLAGKSTERTT